MDKSRNPLLDPASVAIVGCSADPGKHTARPLAYLRKHGYGGPIYPINPKASEIQGIPAYPSITAVDAPIDHALIMVPAKFIPGVIDECVACGVKAATIYSDGFAERGEEGRRRQEALTATAREGGLQLLGPNSMGYINFHTGCTLSPNMILEMDSFTPGGVSLISQSGSMIGALLSRGTSRGVTFSKLISIGNEADLSVGKLVDMLVDDETTHTILLFTESLRNAEDLAKAARRAHGAGKAIIAYKLGRSDAGREIAASHSGALAGPVAAAEAFFEASGILEVRLFESLFEAIPLARFNRPPDLKRTPRAAVVSTTGAAGALVADRLALDGVDLVRPFPALKSRLADHGVPLGDSPIMDLTMAGSRGTVYADALDELIQGSGADAIVAVVGSSGQFVPDIAVRPIAEADRGAMPIVSFIGPHAERSLQLLNERGIPGFRTPESCAEALRAYFSWRTPAPAEHASVCDVAGVDAACQSAARKQLSEVDAAAVFEQLGVPQPQATLIDDNALPKDLRYPVAAKVVSSDVPHKTEAGGVVLGIENADELKEAVRSIRRNVAQSLPDASIEGIMVQSMEHGLGEALVGFVRDAEIGPLVIVGAGGVLAEIYRDTAYRVAPVDLATAREMVAEVRGFAPLRGYRGMPEGDLNALADIVVRVSELALLTESRVSEAEINPVLVKARGEGVVALDGLITLE